MSTTPTTSPTWFGHPRGLTILFLTETWEKFSFFGMRALLVYYMTRQLAIGQAQSSYIYGLYAASAYFTPIVGGFVADRWLGRRRAVLLGATIMAAGHFMMALESLFFPALVVIALGNGLFLPSVPSQIEGLYASNDPRRTSGYSVYYVGINLGAFLAPLVCGTIGELFGWHWGFTAAGVGMLAGLVIYASGLRYLAPDTPRSLPVQPEPQAASPTGSRTWVLLLAVAFAVVVYRGAYEQAGNTVALWIDTGVDRAIGGGHHIPMTWFLALNPLIVFLLTPVALAYWARRAARGAEQSLLSKMSTGALALGGAYLLLAAVSAGGSQAAWPWVVLFFLIMTAGEIYILPIGLALFGQLAPRKHTATVIASWFMATSVGNLFAGAVGSLWSRMTPATFFVLIAAIAAISALLLRMLERPAQRVIPERSAAPG